MHAQVIESLREKVAQKLKSTAMRKVGTQLGHAGSRTGWMLLGSLDDDSSGRVMPIWVLV